MTENERGVGTEGEVLQALCKIVLSVHPPLFLDPPDAWGYSYCNHCHERTENPHDDFILHQKSCPVEQIAQWVKDEVE